MKDETPQLSSYTMTSTAAPLVWNDYTGSPSYGIKRVDYSNELEIYNKKINQAANQLTFGGAVGYTQLPANFTFKPTKEKKMSERNLRIVDVYVIDPDKKVPLEKALVYQRNFGLTDLSDQELFMELASEIMDNLSLHNEARKTTLDKKATAATGKEVFLEAIRIKDLNMVVSCRAVF